MRTSTLKEAAGYSLVESIVAIALLLTVLAPLGSLVAKIATHRVSKQKIEALSIAQSTIEEAIRDAAYEDRASRTQDDKWQVSEVYQFVEDLVIIEVTVEKPNRAWSRVRLQTARLLPPYQQQSTKVF